MNNDSTEDMDVSGSFGTIPSEFLHDKEITQWLQNRVLSVDSNEGRCLVENTKLSFIENDWMLLPDHDIIEQYHQPLVYKDDKWTATRESFPNIPNRNDFQYTFVPLSKTMKEIGIHRQHNIPQEGAPLTPADITTHVYPFDTMPVLKSHLHPKYVILEAGRKLNRLNPTSTSDITARYPILLKLMQIYHVWISERPSNAMKDVSYNAILRVDENGFVTNDISDDSSSEGSVQTQPIRIGFRREETHRIRRKRRRVV